MARTKSTKSHKKAQVKAQNANKRIREFSPLDVSKHIFKFLFAISVSRFLCLWNFWIKKSKTDLITSFTLPLMRQRATTTLSLNCYLNKMYQELSYLLIVSGLRNIVYCYSGTNKQKKNKTASTNFTWLYLYFLTALYFHISVRIFCNLSICLVFDCLLQSICFPMFCSKHSRLSQ